MLNVFTTLPPCRCHGTICKNLLKTWQIKSRNQSQPILHNFCYFWSRCIRVLVENWEFLLCFVRGSITIRPIFCFICLVSAAQVERKQFYVFGQTGSQLPYKANYQCALSLTAWLSRCYLTGTGWWRSPSNASNFHLSNIILPDSESLPKRKLTKVLFDQRTITVGGSITVQLASCFTCLVSAPLLLSNNNLISSLSKSNPVKL